MTTWEDMKTVALYAPPSKLARILNTTTDAIVNLAAEGGAAYIAGVIRLLGQRDMTLNAGRITVTRRGWTWQLGSRTVKAPNKSMLEARLGTSVIILPRYENYVAGLNFSGLAALHSKGNQ